MSETIHETIEITIERPRHYRTRSIETMDYIEDQEYNFAVGCAVKYLARYRYKGEPIRDLKKAAWYILREIRRLETLNAEIGE